MNKTGIIISGTTRGIGKEILELYSSSHFVVSVNRNNDKSQSSSKIIFSDTSATITGDIADIKTWEAVKKFCLENSIEIEKIYFNAGINLSDYKSIAGQSFIDNSEVNFISVATAINSMGIEGSKKFIVLSSMSTIYPNKQNVSYALSKLSCEILFSHLNSFNKTSKFQILRLGPVDTDFTKGVIHDGGLLKKIIFKIVVLESTDCAKLIYFYAQTNKEIVNIPIRSLVIYIILKWLRLFFTPHKSFLYKN